MCREKQLKERRKRLRERGRWMRERLPLVEICFGDHTKRLYIAQTSNIDMDYLKKKWCTYHNFLVRER
jgi:hypothetical protein